MEKVYIIKTTSDKKEILKKIAKELIESKISKCIHIYNTESIYEWKDEIFEEIEFVLEAKVTQNRLKEAQELIKKAHNYELPEIIFFNIGGSKEYIEWIKSS